MGCPVALPLTATLFRVRTVMCRPYRSCRPLSEGVIPLSGVPQALPAVAQLEHVQASCLQATFSNMCDLEARGAAQGTPQELGWSLRSYVTDVARRSGGMS